MGGGRQPSILSGPDRLRSAAASQGGDATMAQDALTFGVMRDGARAGKMRAEYRKVVGTAVATYRVPHGLGFIPAWAMLLGAKNSSGTAQRLVMSWENYDKWSATEITVGFSAVVGGTAGTEMWLLIGGERA